MNASDSAFKALADETRRAIVKMLRTGPRTSGQIADQFHSSWPTISRHLAILRDANLVSAERRGQEIHYELNTSVFQDLVTDMMGWVDRPRSGRKARRPRPQEA